MPEADDFFPSGSKRWERSESRVEAIATCGGHPTQPACRAPEWAQAALERQLLPNGVCGTICGRALLGREQKGLAGWIKTSRRFGGVGLGHVMGSEVGVAASG